MQTVAHFPMSYRDQLQPWCIIRCLPNAQTITVARFRRRSDAEAYLRTLHQLTPTASFRIVFDGGNDRGWEGYERSVLQGKV